MANLLSRIYPRGTLLRGLIPSRRHLTVFHRLAGSAIVLLGLVHGVAHLVSATRVGAATAAERESAFPARSRLATYRTADSAIEVILATWLGFSGLLLLMLFSTVALFSIPLVRKVWFELFYGVHHLVFLATAIAAVHPTTSRTAWFAGLGLGAYIVHRMISVASSLKAHAITGAALTAGRVAAIKFRATPAMHKHLAPGTFVWINLPWLARREWHPFSIASSPLADDITLYVKAVGGASSWTCRVVEAVAEDANRVIGRSIRVAGPFRTDSRNVAAFSHAILIASGIGVTPYASIVSDLIHRAQRGELAREQTISFWWVTRSLDDYEWLLELLAELASQANAALSPSPHRLVTDIRIFVSGASPPSSDDIPTSLAAHAVIAAGRPQFPYMLGYAAAHHTATTPLGVFYCGIASLADDVRAAVRALPHTEYHEESFAPHCDVVLDVGELGLELVHASDVAAAVALPPFGLRLGSIALIMVVSWLGFLAPLVASRFGHGPGSLLLKCGALFGGGVLLATGFVHMLFPALVALTNPCLTTFFTDDFPPLAMAVTIATILGVHLLHTVISRHIHSVHHAIPNNFVHCHESSSIVSSRSSSSASSSDPARSQISHSHSGDASASKARSDMGSDSSQFVHQDSHEDVLALLLIDQQVSTILLECGVALHSLVIGFVVGSAREEFITLLIALSVHQFSEGMALSSTILSTAWRPRFIVLFAVLFSVTTPIGLTLGIIFASRFDANDPSYLLSIGILDAVAAGILIYDALVNILVPGFNDRLAHEASPSRLLLFTASVWTGAALLTVIGAWI
ncbi:uncharacterized protein AMSG_11548 [Thecamonas trahens ATCC 50062]|uniref:FAD-binding FR-type domain-containing protein n=1 Tax=Thecamonas trahens ATCC 50062 TaxID=461836 RepID=A0A0L0D2A8_THETB|nr:hypothetical protein AMSG_11548 [Thecamonas trahens ATCC 50062]KNC46474.1 hypothetical protein AMSG_11548 [Thecamonas trahens ATCC 50062]|eukprot:XP_013752598.1 hypothetical protein AMSG_11548 [Thecamonas trahens ATCC 50062]